MSQQERTSRMAVLLFTDMVDSVALERRLGTEAYSRLLKRHHQLLLQVLEQVHGGEVRNDATEARSRRNVRRQRSEACAQ